MERYYCAKSLALLSLLPIAAHQWCRSEEAISEIIREISPGDVSLVFQVTIQKPPNPKLAKMMRVATEKDGRGIAVQYPEIVDRIERGDRKVKEIQVLSHGPTMYRASVTHRNDPADDVEITYVATAEGKLFVENRVSAYITIQKSPIDYYQDMVCGYPPAFVASLLEEIRDVRLEEEETGDVLIFQRDEQGLSRSEVRVSKNDRKILSLRIFKAGGLSEEIDVLEWSKDDSHSPRLAGRTVYDVRDGRWLSKETWELKSIRQGTLSPDLFHYQLPKGFLVRDLIQNREYWSDSPGKE